MNSILRSLCATILFMGITMSAFTQDSFDRTVKPQALPAPKVKLPDIQKSVLRNGLAVWLVENHELPIVALNLVLQTGSDHDPVSKPGIASMTAEVLDEGTKTRDALQIADELDFIGSNLSVRSSVDGSFVTLNCLRKHLDASLEVFADVLINPAFPQKEFDRIKEQRLTGLLQQKDRPPTIASLAFNKIVYGSEHPYGNDASGNEMSVRTMTREEVVSFYDKYYRPNNATLIVVGDITQEDLLEKLESRLQGWKEQSVKRVMLPAPLKVQDRKVYLIDKPAAAQSEIRIGYPAAPRNTPDYFPLVIANRILGGQFSSRLNMNLREKRGYSYGVRSAFQFNKDAGPFIASGGVVTAKTDSSLVEFLYEIDKMKNEGATAEELEFVKKGLTGSFALTFETPSQIAGSIQNIVLYNLPDDYYEKYIENVNKVTLEDVQRVCKKYLNSSSMAVVVVGDLNVVRQGVENLKLGTAVLCDVEGNKLPQ